MTKGPSLRGDVVQYPLAATFRQTTPERVPNPLDRVRALQPRPFDVCLPNGSAAGVVRVRSGLVRGRVSHSSTIRPTDEPE